MHVLARRSGAHPVIPGVGVTLEDGCRRSRYGAVVAGDPGTLVELFHAGRPADRAAASLLEAPAGVRVTYADADHRSAQLAHVLASFGVRRGDRVAVQVEKSPEAVLLYLACLRYGVVFLPMNTAYSSEEVSYLVDDAEPALFVLRGAWLNWPCGR